MNGFLIQTTLPCRYDHPALKQLIADVDDGLIDVVVVYKTASAGR